MKLATFFLAAAAALHLMQIPKNLWNQDLVVVMILVV
jgi:hypothetical protein